MSFVVYNQIDEGNFGQIFLARKNGGIDDQRTYAMKTIKASPDNSYAEQRRICRNELDIFKLVQRAPFFLQLKYAFKSLHNYHFVFEYIPVGNMYDWLGGQQLALHEAKMCCAEIVCAIAFLHKHQIAYRDLKMENLLISNDGHLLLTDFGLAKKIKNNNKANDEAGTFNYFAPEMINGSKEHGFEVDWWTLGILMSELLIGHSPFLQTTNEAISDDEICERSLNNEPDLSKLRSIHGANAGPIERFIRALLIKDPTQRLGTGQNGYEAIKSDAYFKPINWIAVQLKKYKCLDVDLSRCSETQKIPIDFSNQCKLALAEKPYFHYVAPELSTENNLYGDFIDETNGSSADDVQVLSTRIEIPNSIGNIDIVLSKSLYVKIQNIEQAAETLKRLVSPRNLSPRKMVRFQLPALSPSTAGLASSGGQAPSQLQSRRSERISKRRKSSFISQDREYFS